MSGEPRTVPDNVERKDANELPTKLYFHQYAVFKMSGGNPSEPLYTFATYAEAERFVGESNQTIYRAGLTVDVSEPAEAGR